MGACSQSLKTVPYYVKTLLMALPALLIGLQIPSWIAYLPSRSAQMQSDFRVFYTPGFMLRTGHAAELYNFQIFQATERRVVADDGGSAPFIHPAFEAPIFAPLSLLSYRHAYFLWASVNCVVLALIYKLSRPKLRTLATLLPWLPAALLVSFIPVSFAIWAGQDSLLLLLVMVLAFRRIGASEFQAGLLLGFGMFRFQVLLPVLLLFILWRAWRLVAGCALTSVVLALVSTAIVGVPGQIQYVRLLRTMAVIPSAEMIARMVNLRALLAALDVENPAVLAAFTLVVVLATAAAGWRGSRENQLLLATGGACLVTYYLFLHDLSIMILPLLIALDRALEDRDWRLLAVVSTPFALSGALLFTNQRYQLAALGTVCYLIVGGFQVMIRNRKTSGSLALAPTRS
jgi:hypothetical protein